MPRPVAIRLADSRRQEAEELRQQQRLLATLMLLSALAFGLMALGGCNTVSGAGQDLDAAGKAITSSAEQARLSL